MIFCPVDPRYARPTIPREIVDHRGCRHLRQAGDILQCGDGARDLWGLGGHVGVIAFLSGLQAVLIAYVKGERGQSTSVSAGMVSCKRLH